VIPDWLTSSERLAFLDHSFGQWPCANAGGARETAKLLDWGTLDRVLGSPLAPDVLTVARGLLIDVPMPRFSDQVRALMTRGISTVIRASERHDAGLRRLADAFAGSLQGEIRVQLYVTPGGTYSFGWHYDFEDVFIAQTLGIKDYYLRDNTVARHTLTGETLDFGCIRQERSQIMASRLISGDWLYIPRRWWHFVKCEEDSLSISVGVMPPGEARKGPGLPRHHHR
jgi:JmjC domain